MTEDLKVINGGVATDDRGQVRFVNDFNPSAFGVKRFYQVSNHAVNFVRAFHGHLKESKYVYVPKGSALVAVVPMEGTDKLLYDNVQKWTLSDANPKVLYIPAGYANGFKTLTADTTVMFFSTTTLEESQDDDYRFDWNVYNLGKVWEEDYR